MSDPRPSQRGFVPPVMPVRVGPPPVMREESRVVRNVLVWGVCAIVIIGVVVIFVNLWFPPEMQRLVAPYVK